MNERIEQLLSIMKTLRRCGLNDEKVNSEYKELLKVKYSEVLKKSKKN